MNNGFCPPKGQFLSAEFVRTPEWQNPEQRGPFCKKNPENSCRALFPLFSLVGIIFDEFFTHSGEIVQVPGFLWNSRNVDNCPPAKYKKIVLHCGNFSYHWYMIYIPFPAFMRKNGQLAAVCNVQNVPEWSMCTGANFSNYIYQKQYCNRIIGFCLQQM